jgi:hypothetical protein
MVDLGSAPSPSYIVHDGKLTSTVFGEFDVSGLQTGEYFRRAAAPWVKRATQFGCDKQAAADFFDELRSEFASQLSLANKSILHLADAFDEVGVPKLDGLTDRLDAMVHAYSAGIFSICIANLESSEGIIRKEILQEKLQQQFDCTEGIDAPDRLQLRQDISAYSEACMPFAPVEYPISSRKRLVEDLSKRFGIS